MRSINGIPSFARPPAIDLFVHASVPFMYGDSTVAPKSKHAVLTYTGVLRNFPSFIWGKNSCYETRRKAYTLSGILKGFSLLIGREMCLKFASDD